MGTGVPEIAMDREAALSRVGGDAELLKEIAVIFLDDYPKVLAELHSASERHDAHALERAAHGLKGAVANFGAQPSVEAAHRLEQMGYAGELADVPVALAALEQALSNLRVELETV